jgi:hypothetical protein
MEFASYQQAKIAINKFDGAMTKGKPYSHSRIAADSMTGQTISIRLLPPVQPRAAKPAAAAQTGGSLLSRITGAGRAAHKAAPAARGRGT